MQGTDTANVTEESKMGKKRNFSHVEYLLAMFFNNLASPSPKMHMYYISKSIVRSTLKVTANFGRFLSTKINNESTKILLTNNSIHLCLSAHLS